AIEQHNSTKNARSTVSTATEIADYLRLLFAKVAEPRCPDCGARIVRTTPQSAADALLEGHEGARAHVVARVEPDQREVLRRDGWVRLWGGEGICALDEWTRAGKLPVITDRLVLHDRARLADAIAAAWRLGGGGVEIFVEGRAKPLKFSEGM